MNRSRSRIARIGIALIAASVLLAGCSSGGGETKTTAKPKHVTVTFWTWAAGMDVLVKKFNSTHSDITVKLTSIPNGAAGYAKIRSAVEAGTGPDLAQIEYAQVPTFAVDGLLKNVSSLASKYEKSYVSWAWNSAGFGKQHYGMPYDAGPMVMYYNKALFEKAGITSPPKTWNQFRADGQKLKAATGAKIGTLLDGANFYAGIAWQAGAHWFSIGKNAWKVNMDDPATVRAVSYWSGLVQDGLATVDKGFNTGYWNKLDSGAVATYITGAWGYRGMVGNLKKTKGDWAVTQIPTWSTNTNGTHPTANSGGSSWSVMKGSKHAEAALKFANWLSSDPTAMNLSFENSGYFPAAKDASVVKGLNTGDPFFGGQKLGPVFEAATKKVDLDWTWGPDMSVVGTQLSDKTPALTSTSDVKPILTSIDQAVTKDMKSKGLTVK